MYKEWQLQNAKAKLSQLIKEVKLYGPVYITVRGEPAVVITSCEDYKKQNKISFLELMQTSPLSDENINFERNNDNCREINL